MSDPGYVVYIANQYPFEPDEEAIQAAAWHTLNVVQAADPCALTITLTTDSHVQELNAQYAGIDSTTDVLTFAAEDQPYEVEPGEPPYLGDVIIAVPVAQEQADRAGHSLLNEIQVLAIHGTLHLLGFDHQDALQQAEMWAYQSAAMDAVRSSGYAR